MTELTTSILEKPVEESQLIVKDRNPYEKIRDCITYYITSFLKKDIKYEGDID